MAQYPEFEKALINWKRAALRHFRASKTHSVTRVALERWGRAADGHIRRQDSLHWDFRILEETHGLPEWEELEKAANKYADINKHLNTLVGSSYTRRRMELGDIAHSMLPRPVFASDGQNVELQNKGFAKKYRDFEEFISSDKLRTTTLWPIGGVKLENKVKLSDNATIRPLNDSEILTCLNGGLIRPMFQDVGLLTEQESKYSGLIFTQDVPKRIGEMPTDDNDLVAKVEKEKATLIEKILTTSAVVDIRGIRFGGRTEAADGWPFGFSTFTWSGNPTPNPYHSSLVSTKKLNEFKKYWKLLFSHGETIDKSLYLTARRLAFAEERIRSDDALLDLMIAGEALYLGSDGGSAQDRGELKFRLALRAAYWADKYKVKASKKQVYQLIKDAYDIRSTLAHGDTPKARMFRYKNQQVQVQEFNRAVEAIIRNGLQKAINQTSKTPRRKFKPDWNDKILNKLSS